MSSILNMPNQRNIIMVKLHEYIRNMLVFFNSKFLIENNEVKANAVLTLISQWDKLIDRTTNLDASAPKIAALIKADFHSFILQVKRNKNIFTSNEKRLILSLVVLLQAIRTKDIKGLLFSDLSDVRHLSKIFTDKRIISIHYPTGKKLFKIKNKTGDSIIINRKYKAPEEVKAE
jgi:regulatory protein YycH of two-component signal transduction system YycFG